ncbi:hypothetical protein GPECTOR_17g893 [Gonium pectorale]|uniref:Uncharacterized protein n=1 Tax=Gonium pectorale TaxID=33097 RepID=A0A150GKK4_GONPE|nr:hypothetical protein GPECTOR_17g893 [Gonium pectorale]|eukprot:KXZ50255.1 hypothetical protein GPECTOR_17g893 [Gonium pectorale]
MNAIDDLSINAKNLDRINPALVATAIAYLVVALVIYVMSLWRSFIEAAHDATGTPSRGAVAFMVFGVILTSGWWLVLMWLMLLLMGNTVWAAVIYVTEQAIDQARQDLVTFGSPTWLPSSKLPCPGQCLDLTTFAFISSELKVRMREKLSKSQSAFQGAYDYSIAVLAGNWGMLVAASLLIMNYVCQFAHTKRERELLMRVSSRPYLTA